MLRTRGPRPRATVAAVAALATATRLGAIPLAEHVKRLGERGRLDLGAAESPTDPAKADPLAELGISPREREVLTLLAAGQTNRQIADRLFISPKTASVHVTHLLQKLGVSSRIEAAAVGQRHLRGGNSEGSLT